MGNHRALPYEPSLANIIASIFHMILFHGFNFFLSEKQSDSPLRAGSFSSFSFFSLFSFKIIKMLYNFTSKW